MKGFLSTLRKDQKEAIGLLQIGTFLEYFDLMLYVHMAVLLNELFFPKTDPHTASLLTAFAFCSTYVLRPFGALLFGWIGDNIGRKTTVIITTTMMAISCIIMANLPTYSQIGIAAAWIVTGCRIVQGLSSVGEIIGAQVYVTEITKPPFQYPIVSLIGVSSALGSVMALAIATLMTRFEFNWRIAFWVGACIAVVGSIARTTLRETPEFLEFKAQREKNRSFSPPPLKEDGLSLDDKRTLQKTLLGIFLIFSGWPVSFYVAFMYFNPLLTTSFGYKPEDVILHNFCISLISLFCLIIVAMLSYRVHPLKIIKVRCILSTLFVMALPWLIGYCQNAYHVFALQVCVVVTALTALPAEAILIKIVPVFKRFTTASLIYALSRAFMYVLTSFGLVFLTYAFGDLGLLVIMLPITLGFLWGVRHFESLERDQNLSSPISSSSLPHHPA